MINFDTDRIVLVSYTHNAGGKFLINCLALSMQAELQHSQLLGKFENSQQKFDLLHSLISSNTYFWNDCGMGCFQLLDTINPAVCENLSADEIRARYLLSPILEKLTNSNNLFFLVAHNLSAVENHLAVWRQARVIQFVNEDKWVLHRFGEWNFGSSYESHVKRTELMVNKLVNPTKLIQFDNSNYFDIEQTVQAVETLYNKFNLLDFNETHVRALYQIWYDTILKIKLRNFNYRKKTNEHTSSHCE